ncbi:MAG TPA: hypothetical protein VEY92_08850 [Pseudoxanthomonas sp.]|nr:hypothetical protein [Pseudoxanthomonas sp.]
MAASKAGKALRLENAPEEWAVGPRRGLHALLSAPLVTDQAALYPSPGLAQRSAPIT